MNGLAGTRRHRLWRAGRSLRSVPNDDRSAGIMIDFFGQAFAGKSRKARHLESRCCSPVPSLISAAILSFVRLGTHAQIVINVSSFARTNRAISSGTARPA